MRGSALGTTQEYLLFKRWRDSTDLDRIYIAGDAAQSVYSFRAAEPDYFRETPVDDEVDLTESRRCPSEIASVAAGVLATGREDTDAPHIRAKSTGRRAIRERIETPDELAERVIDEVARKEHEPNDDGRSMFLLARTNRQVGRLGRALENAGIPYGVIGTSLSEIRIEIEEEMLVEHDELQAYTPFGPKENRQQKIPADFISLSGESEVVELTVRTDAPLAGMTISEAVERDVLNGTPLIIAIERDGDILTPHGDTRIHPDDVVTVFSRGGVDDRTVNAFIDSSG